MRPQMMAGDQIVLRFDTAGPGGFKYADLDTLFLLRYYNNGVDSTIYVSPPNGDQYTFDGYMFGI
jgi:hypothetical protein